MRTSRERAQRCTSHAPPAWLPCPLCACHPHPPPHRRWTTGCGSRASEGAGKAACRAGAAICLMQGLLRTAGCAPAQQPRCRGHCPAAPRFLPRWGPMGSCVARDGSWCNGSLVPTNPEGEQGDRGQGRGTGAARACSTSPQVQHLPRCCARAAACCTHAACHAQPALHLAVMVCEDSTRDARFSCSPYVKGAPSTTVLFRLQLPVAVREALARVWAGGWSGLHAAAAAAKLHQPSIPMKARRSSSSMPGRPWWAEVRLQCSSGPCLVHGQRATACPARRPARGCTASMPFY